MLQGRDLLSAPGGWRIKGGKLGRTCHAALHSSLPCISAWAGVRHGSHSGMPAVPHPAAWTARWRCPSAAGSWMARASGPSSQARAAALLRHAQHTLGPGPAALTVHRRACPPPRRHLPAQGHPRSPEGPAQGRDQEDAGVVGVGGDEGWGQGGLGGAPTRLLAHTLVAGRPTGGMHRATP